MKYNIKKYLGYMLYNFAGGGYHMGLINNFLFRKEYVDYVEDYYLITVEKESILAGKSS